MVQEGAHPHADTRLPLAAPAQTLSPFPDVSAIPVPQPRPPTVPATGHEVRVQMLNPTSAIKGMGNPDSEVIRGVG